MKMLMMCLTAASLFVAVPAFACGGHDKADTTAENACGKCGTDECTCKDKKAESCESCGTDACTCDGKKEDKKAS